MEISTTGDSGSKGIIFKVEVDMSFNAKEIKAFGEKETTDTVVNY